jgi:hypothetical protein
MQKYLLSIYQPDGDPPPPAILASTMRNLDELNKEIRDAGARVFAGGLHPPGTATVVRHQDDDVVVTNGPYIKGQEHVGAVTVIQAPDLDAALTWGRKYAQVLSLPIEVRPMQ